MSARVHTLRTSAHVQAGIEDVFDFFADAANLESITPPELRFRIRTPLPIPMRTGARIDYQLTLFRIPFRWKTEITSWQLDHSFVDEQLSGPFRLWHHTHHFEEATGGTQMTDTVRYSLPLAPVGELAHPIVRRQLKHIFDYRAEVIPDAIAEHIRVET